MDRSEIADLLSRTDFWDGMHEIGALAVSSRDLNLHLEGLASWIGC